MPQSGSFLFGGSNASSPDSTPSVTVGGPHTLRFASVIASSAARNVASAAAMLGAVPASCCDPVPIPPAVVVGAAGAAGTGTGPAGGPAGRGGLVGVEEGSVTGDGAIPGGGGATIPVPLAGNRSMSWEAAGPSRHGSPRTSHTPAGR